MRIKLSIKQNNPNQLIPINYQFAISSFIYRTIETADSSFSKWLHDSGYKSGSKRFKFFTFSKLNIPRCGMIDLYNKKYLKIESDKMELIVSMMIDKTVENFIIGMFENQKLNIYDKNTESNFRVNTVEMIPEPDFRNEMIFKTLSPVIISRNSVYKGKESQTYLNPEDKEYFEYFKKNLEEKYITYSVNMFNKDNRDSGLPDMKEASLESFELNREVKSKLITIKEGTPEETRVRGYLFTCRIKGNPKLMKIGYESGFGKHCSQGFGCMEPV
ncbi:MAG TPA: CRISPR-associated endoribonuclease Cas6 [Ignavibacteria bacterium]|nr:CRISPR-associated endoribonuclease Cas6 [Bacteroidota bacterium]HRI86407.1 CRISPR-associated endoribonuclease Cas6 [Ignavibacteria bacterium]HRK00456.1 CRISPR-associated endoribonuclease Cas6 [Ignavibacteria bacterium]